MNYIWEIIVRNDIYYTDIIYDIYKLQGVADCLVSIALNVMVVLETIEL